MEQTPTNGPKGSAATAAPAPVTNPSSDTEGGDIVKGAPQMAENPIAQATEDIAALTAQVEAAKSATANETDDVKVARQLLRAAKVLEDAVSYNGVWESHESEETRKQLPRVKAATTQLKTIAEMVAPNAAAFDKSTGTTLAGRLKLFVQAAEAGYAPEDLGKAAAEAIAAWGTVKGTGGGGGPRAPKGEGSLGFLLVVNHSSWDKPLNDSTGKGSAMSSALGKIGQAMDPKISGAARKTWLDAGKVETYDDLAKCLDEVIKGGADGAEYGDWTVSAEGRAAKEAEAA